MRQRGAVVGMQCRRLLFQTVCHAAVFVGGEGRVAEHGATSACQVRLPTKTLVSPCPSLPTLSTFQRRQRVHHRVVRFMGLLRRSGNRLLHAGDFERALVDFKTATKSHFYA